MKPDVQCFIKFMISLLLNHLRCLFHGDELAYYSLQGKNELQIRDKFAWYMQSALDIKFGKGCYIVRREWSPSGRSKVDLAILQVEKTENVNNDYDVKPIVLLEFKAHSFLNMETWPYAAFLIDIQKMYDMIIEIKDEKDEESAKEIEMYFIFLHSTQSRKPTKYQAAISYVDIFSNNNTRTDGIKSDFLSYWRGFYEDSIIYNAFYTKKKRKLDSHHKVIQKKILAFGEKYKLPQSYLYKNRFLINYMDNNKANPNIPNIQNIGAYLEYEWFVAPFIWGPYKVDFYQKSTASINVY